MPSIHNQVKRAECSRYALSRPAQLQPPPYLVSQSTLTQRHVSTRGPIQTNACTPVMARPRIRPETLINHPSHDDRGTGGLHLLWISLCPSYVCVTNRFA